MKVRRVRNIGSISLSVLLFASILVIISNSTSYANAEEQAEVNAATSSSGSDDVAAASGSNRFVVWMDETPGNYEIFFSRSTDNGVTWKPRVNLSNNPGPSESPLIGVSGSHVYVVWRQVSASGTSMDIILRHSADNGATWKTPVNISNRNYGNSQSPELAVSGSNVYVTWQDENPGPLDDILFRRSTDSGETWKPIVNLSNDYNPSELPQIAAAGSNVYVTWDDRNFGEILFRRSTDNGATWKPTVNLSSNPGDSSFPRIAASGSNVYVVWDQENAEETASDIFFRRSTDGGATWKSKVNFSNDGHSEGPYGVAVSGSNVYVVYWDGSDILFRRSTDNGATWKSKLNLSNDPESSIYPRIAVSGSNVYVTWQKENPGLDDILFRRSTDSGATWKSKVNLSNVDDARPVVQMAASGSELYVVWHDIIGPNYDIFLKRSINSGATWNALKNLSNNAGSSFSPQIAV